MKNERKLQIIKAKQKLKQESIDRELEKQQALDSYLDKVKNKLLELDQSFVDQSSEIAEAINSIEHPDQTELLKTLQKISERLDQGMTLKDKLDFSKIKPPIIKTEKIEMPDWWGDLAPQFTTLRSVSPATIVDAQEGYYLDLYGLILANSSEETVKVTITSNGAKIVFMVPRKDTRGFMLPADSGYRQDSPGEWLAGCDRQVSSVHVTAFARRMNG